MSRIFMSKATVGPEEEEAAIRALRSGWVAPLGPEVDAFEAEVCSRVGARHAVALSSGTAALHLALLELGARADTAVVLPTMTFAATANAVAYTGAEAIFVDSNSADGNVDPFLMIDAVRILQREGVKVVAAVSVDLFGRCANYTVLEPGLSELGVPIIADAAESLGSCHEGVPAGAHGRATAFSFNGNKVMTTSGGGMLVSNDSNLIARARHLSTQAREPRAWYEHTEIGFNYRLSNILAAIGRAQLNKLDDFISRRQSIRQLYAEGLSEVSGLSLLSPPTATSNSIDNSWLTSIILSPEIEVSASDLIAHLDSHDIEARHLWKPMHLQPLWRGARLFGADVSERLFESGLTLPSGSGLTDSEVARVIEAIRIKLNHA